MVYAVHALLKGFTVKFRIPIACSLALLLAFVSTSGALAHASLTHANIKNGAVYHVKSVPKTLQAFFAETLDPKASWINVFEGVGDHGLVNEKTKSVVNFKNPKEMILRLPKLQPDKYYFVWYTHSEDDDHYAAGIVYFRVIK
jgi:methionine-rich copper-binding protein CopC